VEGTKQEYVKKTVQGEMMIGTTGNILIQTCPINTHVVLRLRVAGLATEDPDCVTEIMRRADAGVELLHGGMIKRRRSENMKLYFEQINAQLVHVNSVRRMKSCKKEQHKK